MVIVNPNDVLAAFQIEKDFSLAKQTVRFKSLGADARIPGRFVVGFKTGGETDVIRWVENAGGHIVRLDRAAGFLVVGCDDSGFGSNSKGCCPNLIRYIEPDFRVKLCHIPNDPYFLEYQWDKWVMYADLAWDITTGGNVKVAVIDNGVEYWHPELAARFDPGELGYDFVHQDDDPRPDDPTKPEAFHGTHVSGIIAATADNNQGIAGWAQVQLLAVKVLDDSGSGNTSDLASGIYWAVNHGARVINMSLAADAAPTSLLDACQYASRANVVLVAAAGNQGVCRVQYPAALKQCICVGATDGFSGLAGFSNYGPEQEVVVPGVGIYSSGVGGSYLFADGTSMAAPEVSGVAALILARDNTLSATRVRAIIDASAIDKGKPGRDDQYGYGFVNARRALDLAVLITPGPGPDQKRTEICRGNIMLPDWAERLVVYDCQGRLVSILDGATNRSVRLLPGTYFAVFSNRKRIKLVVLR